MINRKRHQVYDEVWIVAYVGRERECFELRSGFKVAVTHSGLWRDERQLGLSLADLVHEDLTKMDSDVQQLERYIDTLNRGNEVEETLEKIEMIVGDWLRIAPIFVCFSAEVQRLTIAWKKKQELNISAVKSVAEQYHLYQNKMKSIAENCFEIEEQTDMAMRYMDMHYKLGKDFIVPAYGNVHMDTAFIESQYPLRYPRTDEQDIFVIREGERTIVEELITNSLSELVGFLLSKYLFMNVRFRSCKQCGKYFGVTGNYRGEYCDRVMVNSEKTCKQGGSLRLYTQRKMEDPIMQIYKRSYKAHHARIRYNLMTVEEFQAWSVEARERRDQCMAGKLNIKEFMDWLDSDKR